MSEIRKVIGVFDHLITNKTGIAFPSVRVWIRGANDYVTDGLEELFPERGTVYLHVSSCENQHPQRNQVGLFNCVESPGQTAVWRVDSTSRHLAKVIECTTWDRKPDHLAFLDWIGNFKEISSCSILLGQGLVYVRRGKRQLVGPFTLSPEGRLIQREHTSLFEDVEVVSIEVSGRKWGFIDADLLPKGKPIILDPREAVRRRLKLLSKTGHLDWFSRAKAQELSGALADVAITDGSEWILEDLPRAIEALASSGKLDENLAESLLQIKSLENTLEIAWKKTHGDAVKKADQEVANLKASADAVKRTADEVKRQVVLLETQKANLENDLRNSKEKNEALKVEAQQVYEAELKRLARSPESMALMGTWIGERAKVPERGRPLVTVQKVTSELRQAVDLKTALFNNLKSCNVSPIVAAEVTDVCRAALAAGQPLAIRSLFAGVLANAVISGLGQPAAIWMDVPAGLLDPIDWSEIGPSGNADFPHILENANRSDISLVLGSLRRAVLERAMGIQKSGMVVLLTLEANPTIRVQADFPIGPLIDERVLRFSPGKISSSLSAYSDFAKQLSEVTAMSAEEFAEIGDVLRKLGLFKLSAHEYIFRRAYAALSQACEKPEDAPRLFFKYWCLPRCETEEALAVLDAHKDKWQQDKGLMELREALQSND